jgi:hypothetical protein
VTFVTFGLYFFRYGGLSVDEIQTMLEENEKQHRACDVLLMPPEEDDLTDEDSDEDEGILPKDPDHLGRGILSQVTEVLVSDEDDQLPDLTEVCICIILVEYLHACIHCGTYPS